MNRIVVSFCLITLSYFNVNLNAQNPELWGMTRLGGVNNSGIIFKTDIYGNNQTVVHSFNKEGIYPNGSLIEASDGKFYAMTSDGGAYDSGVLFEYNPSNDTYIKKINFGGTDKGSQPYGNLVQASNGKLYGMTSVGGAFYNGVLFEFDPTTEIFTKKLDFNYNNTDKGSQPYGSLIQASNGKLYGMTSHGGTFGLGVLFEYDPQTDVFTKKIDFDGSNTGRYPKGSLMQASNGKLYGMTREGGADNSGVLFEYNPTNDTYIKKINFGGTDKGSQPYGDLIQASNGKLYGMTSYGGTFNNGVLFEYDPASETYTKKLDFVRTNNGSNPYGSLIQASDGNLYGMTYYGGTFGKGVLFQFNPITETYTKKLDFDGTNNGRSPYGSLIQASNGKLYGMTKKGGTFDYGVLFKYDFTTNVFFKKMDFEKSSQGSQPFGSLIQASNRKLYGMTSYGGTYNNGVLFQFNPRTEIYTKKLDFNYNDTDKGSKPFGSLIQASNGMLYGMTHDGGTFYGGVLFEYNPVTETYIKKLDFEETNNGCSPYGSLIQASNGKLYGMTSGGGTFNKGVLFEYNPSSETFTKKLDFDGANTGSYPHGDLIQASNGKLYGMTYGGGTLNKGVVFEYNLTNETFTVIHIFEESDMGRNPYGSLIQAADGKLYGITNLGGTSDYGVLFEYDLINNLYTKKLNFDGSNNGRLPFGSLFKASTGKLYGMTYGGGTFYYGVLFEYDPVTDTYTKKLDFDESNGGLPLHTNLIETNICYNTTSVLDITICDSYTVPSGDETYTVSGVYTDTIPNVCGSDSLITINLTIGPYQTDTVVTTVCDIFNWYGTNYSTSGEYIHTLLAINGCDSIITLHLLVDTVLVIQDGATLTVSESDADYQWINCEENSQISGEIGQSFTASENGNYAVIVDNGLCSDTSACYNVTGISINDVKKDQQIFIYPNPSNGMLTVQGNNIESVSVTDLTGKLMLKKVINGDKALLDMSGFSKSIYILRVETEKGLQVKKIIIE